VFSWARSKFVGVSACGIATSSDQRYLVMQGNPES
jgi:hypothetical protein